MSRQEQEYKSQAVAVVVAAVDVTYVPVHKCIPPRLTVSIGRLDHVTLAFRRILPKAAGIFTKSSYIALHNPHCCCSLSTFPVRSCCCFPPSVVSPSQISAVGNVPNHLQGALPGAWALPCGGVRFDARPHRPPTDRRPGFLDGHVYHRRRFGHHVRLHASPTFPPSFRCFFFKYSSRGARVTYHQYVSKLMNCSIFIGTSAVHRFMWHSLRGYCCV